MTTKVKDNQLKDLYQLLPSTYIKTITAGENVYLYDDGEGDIKISVGLPYVPPEPEPEPTYTKMLDDTFWEENSGNPLVWDSPVWNFPYYNSGTTMLVPVGGWEVGFNSATSMRIVVDLTGHTGGGATFYATLSSGPDLIGGGGGEVIVNPAGENIFIIPLDFTGKGDISQLVLGYSYLAGESPWVLKDVSFLIP